MSDGSATLVPDDERRSWDGLDVSFAVDGRYLVVALRGEIDAANVAALPTVVAGASNGDDAVRLDIGDVTFLDSSLLRAILACEAMLAATGVELKVRRPTEQARRIFEITSLSYLLE
jgi:anti-anti-sigma factor